MWAGAAWARNRPWSVVFWLPSMLWLGWVGAVGVGGLASVGGGPWAGIGALISLGMSVVAVLLAGFFWMVRPSREAWRWPWVAGVSALCVAGAWGVNEHQKVPVQMRIMDGDEHPLAGAEVEMSFGGNLKQIWRADAEGRTSGWWRPKSTVFMQVRTDSYYVSSPNSRSWVRLEWRVEDSGYRVERTWTRSIGNAALYETVREQIPTGRLTELRLVVPRQGELAVVAMHKNPALVEGGACTGMWLERLAELPAEGMTEETAWEATRLLTAVFHGLQDDAKERETPSDAEYWGAKWPMLADAWLEWALSGPEMNPRRIQILAELGSGLEPWRNEITDRLSAQVFGGRCTANRSISGEALSRMGLTDAQLERLLDTGRVEWLLVAAEARRNRWDGPLGRRVERELREARPTIRDPELARRADQLIGEFEREAKWRETRSGAN